MKLTSCIEPTPNSSMQKYSWKCNECSLIWIGRWYGVWISQWRRSFAFSFVSYWFSAPIIVVSYWLLYGFMFIHVLIKMGKNGGTPIPLIYNPSQTHDISKACSLLSCLFCTVHVSHVEQCGHHYCIKILSFSFSYFYLCFLCKYMHRII